MSSIITIPTSLLFFPYKPYLDNYYKEYWRKDGNYLWMGNHPLAIFAEDYIRLGRNIFKNLDDHVFIRYEYDRYSDAPTVKDDTHKFVAAKRVMKMVDSIKKHGYCSGKYDKSRHLIRAYKIRDQNHYLRDSDVYVLKSRKHRACVCCSLSMTNIKIKVVG